jgi:thiol-disulfide isomerase/thioredoxin
MYNKLKTGAFAPNIVFDKKYVFSNDHKISDLNQIQSDLILLVFGSSKCYSCIKEIPLLENIYSNFKNSKKLEIVLISLDENEHDFKHFTENFSFISACSFEKYNTLAVKDYHIQHTPTFYLLNKELKILLKPSSTKHLESWLNK